jgi:hypothetical protein
MNLNELKSLLNLFMCSDPWPTTAMEKNIIERLLDSYSKIYGYENWLDAYHNIKIEL